MTSPLLEAKAITKTFPGVRALDGVSLHLDAGEVLAVVGENGAGKSTLMKILAGVYTPDAGQILLRGQPIRIRTVADALRHGIVLIHQELNLAETLSVSANLFLGREALRLGFFLDQRRMNRDAKQWLSRLGLEVSPETRVHDLTPGQRQMVEIARALVYEATILIMDEPTSSLTQRETDRLFEVIAKLRREGVATVYISHRLPEVQQIADRVTVLRDGRNAGNLAGAEINHANLVRLMVGRDLQQFYQRKHAAADSIRPVEMAAETPLPITAPPPENVPRLEVRNLLYAGGPRTPVSLALYPGEIVGMAGLVGAGRTELAEAIYGIRRVTGGEVLLDGRRVWLRRPSRSIAAGLVLVPEDRRYHGLVLQDSVKGNIALPNLRLLNFLGLIAGRKETRLAEDTCRMLRVSTPSIHQQVELLSGGNQQKVVLGKWLIRRPRVLILDEPTRGIDVGAKSEIYALMDELAGEGAAMLMISSDLEEIIGMSDRVLVMHEGRLAGELHRDQLSEEAIMHLATGG